MTDKQYNSLGQIIKAQDFKTLYEKLISFKDTEDFEVITEIVKGNPTSIVDDLLFFMPGYVYDKTQQLNPYVNEVVDILLEYGANPNAVYKNGVTPFLMFSSINNVELLKKLINNPFKKRIPGKEKLLEYKGNVNQADGRGCKPIFYAALTESVDVMEFLVKECGVNLNEKNIFLKDKTILHFLAESISTEAVIENGGLNYLDNFEVVKMAAIDKAISLGADPTITNYEGLTPEELIPSQELYPNEEIPPETIDAWDAAYDKIGNYRLSIEKEKLVNKAKIII